jgi:N-acyl-D-amino-acid deacylase
MERLTQITIRLGIMFLLGFALSIGCRAPAPWFDVVLINGTIVDGSGTPPFAGDIALKWDVIVRVGKLSRDERRRSKLVVDVSNLVVSPGFIDIHTHSDYTLLVDGTAQSKVRQGVTTEILGEADSAGPFTGQAQPGHPYGLNIDWRTLGEYFQRLQKGGTSVNVASFVGATQVRRCVLGEESRAPTRLELDEMKRLVDEAMKEGALGLSCALLVPPNTYHRTSQLIELASVVKPYGGTYFTHIRSEGEGIQDAIKEAIEVGEKAGVPVDIIHLKIADRRLWGRMKEICDLIESARSRGLQISANQYPYTAGQNDLVALIPPWAMEGGREKMVQRLAHPALRKRMEKEILKGIPGWFDHYLAIGDWDRCQIASVGSEKNKRYEGMSIEEISGVSGKSPTDVVFDLLKDENGSVPAIYFLMSEEDVRYAMQRPWVSFGSDGSAVRLDGILGQGKPHPRWYGTFPRVLAKYVREEHVLTLEEAIRKMTSLNAEKLGFSDRGLLREGMKADVTVFDPHRVIDKATFQAPNQYAVGIEYVFVNGVLVIEKGEHLGTKPGRILRRNSQN